MKLNIKPSSNVSYAEYNHESKVLTIQYANGGQYNYLDVPAVVAQELEKAESTGRFVAANIINKYKHTIKLKAKK